MHRTRNTRIAQATLSLAAALTLLLAGGCRREEMLQEERLETVGLSFENDDPGTRVFFREDGSLYFCEVSRNEPAIDVHTSSGAYKSCAVNIDESSVQVPISQGEYRDGFAIYPAGIVQNNSTSAVTINYQSEYHHFGEDAPGYAQDFLGEDCDMNLCYARIPMIAVNTPDEGLVFRHVGGMLSFAVCFGWDYGGGNYYLDSATGYVTKMTFTVGGDKIAGTATVSNPTSANPTATIAPGDGSSTVTVYLDDDHGDIAGLGREDLLQDLFFINIPVPCGTYNGLVIRCYDADDNEVCGYADDTVREIGRGEGRTMGWVFDRYQSGQPLFTSFWPDHITITDNGVSDYSGNLLIPLGSTSSVKGTIYTYPINNPQPLVPPFPADHPSRITTIAPVKYYSRNTSVVTVNEDTGEITTVAPGTTSIYATATYLGHTITSEDHGVNVLGHAFSVAADKQVYFAPGNLAYSDGALSFYAHGYEAFCQLNENRFEGNSSISSDLMDRYSGYLGPSIHSMSELSFPAGFDMFTFKSDVSLPGSWRLLSRSEWAYLINDRNDALKKFCGGFIDFGGDETLCGVIILPDTFVDPMVNQASEDHAFGPARKTANSYFSTHPSKNIYSVEGWAAMEAAGAIFLPTIPFFNDYDTVYTLTYNNSAGDFFYLLSDGRTAFGTRAGNMAERLEVWATEELPADQSLLFYVRAVYDAQ